MYENWDTVFVGRWRGTGYGTVAMCAWREPSRRGFLRLFFPPTKGKNHWPLIKASPASRAHMASVAASSSAGTCPLFHLVPAAEWDALEASETYFPATYAADGFTHLTGDAALLLDVANHFYTDIPGDYVVLELDARALRDAGEVKWEPAADVGDKKSFAKEEESEGAPAGASPRSSRTYGGIPKSTRLIGQPLHVIREDSTGGAAIQYPFTQVWRACTLPRLRP